METGVPVRASTKVLDFVEVKDYLTQTGGSKGVKSSGWRALKSVVQWWDTTMEIQIQVLSLVSSLARSHSFFRPLCVALLPKSHI
jgi:hypothetical protein